MSLSNRGSKKKTIQYTHRTLLFNTHALHKLGWTPRDQENLILGKESIKQPLEKDDIGIYMGPSQGFIGHAKPNVSRGDQVRLLSEITGRKEILSGARRGNFTTVNTGHFINKKSLEDYEETQKEFRERIPAMYRCNKIIQGPYGNIKYSYSDWKPKYKPDLEGWKKTVKKIKEKIEREAIGTTLEEARAALNRKWSAELRALREKIDYGIF